jgi:hypothetical protein
MEQIYLPSRLIEQLQASSYLGIPVPCVAGAVSAAAQHPDGREIH